MITRRDFLAGGAAALALAGNRSMASAPAAATKRGCCFALGETPDWQERVRLLSPAWMYSWGAESPQGLSDSVEFAPMIWGTWSRDDLTSVCDNLRGRYDAGEFQHVLGFNEPDSPEQADLSVRQVVEAWPELMKIGAPLVSPGCVHPDRRWMTRFMDQVEQRDLRVDAIAVHTYEGPSLEHLIGRLTKLHDRFGLPLWITEIAVGDWNATTPESNKHRPDRVTAYVRELLPALDELPFVERYAWFSAEPTSAKLGTSALFDGEGRLTPLGEVYASHGA